VPAGAIEYELAIAEADPPAPEPAPQQSTLERVCALGFAPSEATAALAACGGDALRAVERLASAQAVAQAEAATKATVEQLEATVEQLEATVEQLKMQAATTQARAEAEVMLAKAEAAEAKAEAAAAKLASPAISGPTIDEWLAGLHLEVYTAAVKETGYTVLLFLKDAHEEDLDEMARDIGMKRPHLRTLKRACKQLVAEADSGGVASSTALEPELEPEESHGAFIEPQEPVHEFDLVFSNKTAFDSLCLEVRAKLVPEGVRVWQQRTNIPKDSDNCKSPRSSVSTQACIFRRS
jgi:cell division protein FtsB